MLLPSPGTRAVASSKRPCCSFYFRRWIKSNSGTEAVVGGTGQWQPPRSWFLSRFCPGHRLRSCGVTGRDAEERAGMRGDAQGCPGVPTRRAPPRLPSRGCWSPTLPSSAAGAQGQPAGIAEHGRPRAAHPGTRNSPRCGSARRGTEILGCSAKTQQSHGQPCHGSCFVPRMLEGSRNVQIALLKSKTLQLLTSAWSKFRQFEVPNIFVFSWSFTCWCTSYLLTLGLAAVVCSAPMPSRAGLVPTGALRCCRGLWSGNNKRWQFWWELGCSPECPGQDEAGLAQLCQLWFACREKARGRSEAEQVGSCPVPAADAGCLSWQCCCCHSCVNLCLQKTRL